MRKDHSGFIDMARSLSTHNFDVDSEGRVNTMFVRRRMSIEKAAAEYAQAGQKPGHNLSQKLQEKLSNTDAKQEVDFLEAVMPNQGHLQGLSGLRNKFVKVVVEVATKHEVLREGFISFPYFVPRWEVAEGERKGRGQGEKVLPDVKSLNVMTKANLKAGEMAGDPAWGGPDEGQVSVTRIRPGAYVAGSFNRQGQQLVAPLVTGGQSPFSLEMANQLREAIKDGMYFSLLQLVGRSGMATVEVIERTEEKQRLMAPYLGRLNSEFHEPFVQRRWDLFQTVPGLVDAPPPVSQHGLRPRQKRKRLAMILRHQDFEQVGDVAPLERDVAVHIRFAEPQFRVQHQSRQCRAGVEPYRYGIAAAVAEFQPPAARNRHVQAAPPDESCQTCLKQPFHRPPP